MRSVLVSLQLFLVLVRTKEAGQAGSLPFPRVEQIGDVRIAVHAWLTGGDTLIMGDEGMDRYAGTYLSSGEFSPP